MKEGYIQSKIKQVEIDIEMFYKKTNEKISEFNMINNEFKNTLREIKEETKKLEEYNKLIEQHTELIIDMANKKLTDELLSKIKDESFRLNKELFKKYDKKCQDNLNFLIDSEEKLSNLLKKKLNESIKKICEELKIEIPFEIR